MEKEWGKENIKREEEEEALDGPTLDNDPSDAQCSRLWKSNEKNQEKWQRFEEIFSLYYAENGDLSIPRAYQYQGIKIGYILNNIRR